jgi:hypothetical protein
VKTLFIIVAITGAILILSVAGAEAGVILAAVGLFGVVLEAKH